MIYGAVFLLSASLLGLEVVWMRLLAFQQWAHVSSLVISNALLGFAVSGALVAATRRRLTFSWQRSAGLLTLACAASIPLSFVLVQKLPLDPFRILWEPGEWLPLLGLSLLLFAPFLLGASALALLFCVENLAVPRLYAANLSGSGAGVLAALGLLALVPFKAALICLTVAGVISAILLWPGQGRPLVVWSAAILVVLLGVSVQWTPLAVYANKPLARNLKLPGVQVRAEESGPWGIVHIVAGPTLRNLPGLSLRHSDQIPQVEVIYLDGDTVGSRLPSETALTRPLTFFPFLIQSLPYAVLEKPRVLVTEAGGGMPALGALQSGAASVSVVEQHPALFKQVQEWLEPIRAARFPDRTVKFYLSEPRGLVRSGQPSYDLIVLDRLGSPSSSFAGVHAFEGDYLLTVEGLSALYQNLTDQGVLSITSWLDAPPRLNLKLFAAVSRMLRETGSGEPGRHFFAARDWVGCTTLVFRQPLSPGQIERLRDFCRERDFDLVFYPGMEAGEANQHHVLPEPCYFEAARALLERDGDAFIRHYPFGIDPATDDRPYFNHFLRLSTLPDVWRELGRDRILLAEWGYLAAWLGFLSALVLGSIFLIFPVLVERMLSGRGAARESGAGRGYRLVFFGLLGAGFMIYEMLLLEKCALFLSYPMLAVALVLAAILVFSSLGGLSTERAGGRSPPNPASPRGRALSSADPATPKQGRPCRWFFGARSGVLRSFQFTAGACLLLAGVGGIYAMGLDRLFQALLGCRLEVRAPVVLLVMAPICFCMGLPFPSALRELRRLRPEEVPAVWGFNGWAGVLAAGAAPLLAMHLGMRAALGAGAACYLAAGFLALRENAVTGRLGSASTSRTASKAVGCLPSPSFAGAEKAPE